VEGSLILLSGEPGIGKSTLTLQICKAIASQEKNVLYISGEESVEQIAIRADRLGAHESSIRIVTENNLEQILALIEKEKSDFIVVDSIQVLSSEELPGASGSVSQVKLCAEALMHAAKLWNKPILLIGHVTKEGTLAGPRTLEHLVDTVLYIEGDRYHNLRLLRSTKNRFGSTNEVAVFEMDEKGLKEVTNPSKFFLEGRANDAIGSCLTATIEGTRPFIVEIQALSSLTNFGYPKRSSNGYDLNRLQMIIAVLQEHAHVNLTNQDVFVNVVGGMHIEEPAADLAVALAIASAYRKRPLPADLIAVGELGLSGEIRSVTQTEKREKEAKKLGFTKTITPQKYRKISEAIAALTK
jgi:DNA repair protein RadA/Sms